MTAGRRVAVVALLAGVLTTIGATTIALAALVLAGTGAQLDDLGSFDSVTRSDPDSPAPAEAHR